jgi:hypothetical protein
MSTNDTMKLLRALGFLAVPLTVIGCAKPAATTPPDGADAGAEADAEATAREVVRTVETRSPFGNLDVPDNLLLDGDFEFTGRSGQMPWLAFGGTGQGTLNFATGGICRSGIRCAAVAPGTEMIGWMASPKSGGMNVSLWAKPPSGNCGDLRAFITDIEGESDGDGLRAETPQAAASGWCRYEVDSANYAGKQPVLYVSTASSRVQGPIIVDDVVARALPSTLKRTLAVRPLPLDVASKARVRFIGEWVRKHRIYGLPERSSIEGPGSKLIDAPRTTIR